MNTTVRKRARRLWNRLKQNCYNPASKGYPNVGGRGVVIGEEWKTFDDFYEWYVANDYDIPCEYTTINRFILGNGLKEYSPKTCVMLPAKLNSIFLKSTDINSGIYKTKYGYKVILENSRYKGAEQQGTWKDIHKAREVYRACKTQYFREILEDYEYYMPPDLYEMLQHYEFKADYKID